MILLGKARSALRATRTEHGALWISSVAVEPIKIPTGRLWPCEPTATSVLPAPSISLSSRSGRPALAELERRSRAEGIARELEALLAVARKAASSTMAGVRADAAHQAGDEVVGGQQGDGPVRECCHLTRSLDRFGRAVDPDQYAPEDRDAQLCSPCSCGLGAHAFLLQLSDGGRTTRTEDAARCATRSLTLPSAAGP